MRGLGDLLPGLSFVSTPPMPVTPPSPGHGLRSPERLAASAEPGLWEPARSDPSLNRRSRDSELIADPGEAPQLGRRRLELESRLSRLRGMRTREGLHHAPLSIKYF